jgi:hypothetical protein
MPLEIISWNDHVEVIAEWVLDHDLKRAITPQPECKVIGILRVHARVGYISVREIDRLESIDQVEYRVFRCRWQRPHGASTESKERLSELRPHTALYG